MKVEVRFCKKIDTDAFVKASKKFMGKVKMRRFKITYILGGDTKIAYVEGDNSNEVLIKFLLDNKSVTDVKEIKEVAE